VPDGPFEGEVEAGIFGGAQGFAEHVRKGGEAVGEALREIVSVLLRMPNMA
jgi:hypothetical protein